MFLSIDIIKTLDQIRISQKVKIQDLVEGVMSRKKYTRLLNDETSISFFDLSKLLTKLSIPFQEFSLHVVNTIEHQYPNESNFYLDIIHEHYKKAYDELYPTIKDNELKTLLGSKAVPALVELMLYKLAKQSATDALCRLDKILNLNDLLKEKIINDGLVGALYAYVYVTDDNQRRRIGSYIHEALFDKSYKYYLAYTEISKTLLHITGILAFTMLESLTIEDQSVLEKIILYALDYQTKFRATILDYKIFSILYKFQKKMGYKNDHIVFNYINSYLSVSDIKNLPNKIEVTKEDLGIFKAYLKKDIFKQEKMYEGILSYGKIW